MFDKPITTPLQALHKLKEKVKQAQDVAHKCYDHNKREMDEDSALYYKGNVEAFARCQQMIEDVECMVHSQDRW